MMSLALQSPKLPIRFRLRLLDCDHRTGATDDHRLDDLVARRGRRRWTAGALGANTLSSPGRNERYVIPVAGHLEMRERPDAVRHGTPTEV